LVGGEALTPALILSVIQSGVVESTIAPFASKRTPKQTAGLGARSACKRAVAA
jgi:hypothetical protein